MYFKGYSRKVVMDENMEMHSEYVYEGTYYTMDCPDNVWIRRKGRVLILFLLAAVTLIWGMMGAAEANARKGIVFLQAASLLLLLGTAICVCCRLSAGRKMTDWEYRMSVVSIREFALMDMLALGAAAAAVGCGVLFGLFAFSMAEVTLFLKLVAGAAFSWILMREVKKEVYREEISQDLPHGVDMTNDFENI
ncbi:MAG: hypothetical protein LUH00_13690 [Lachnospiraceae bacterium]|nr:hypothetical protein [Lachnospiraceae bacterium]